MAEGIKLGEVFVRKSGMREDNVSDAC